MLETNKQQKKVVKKKKEDNREISWARKYRPQTMEDYVGNDRVKTKISKALAVNKLPQTILFQGERGTGKTTMARLLAKSLLCENQVDGNACNECPTCKLMDEKYILTGESIKDLAIDEYDIGSAGKIENAREIVARMGQSTLRKRKRIVILDEIQRASTDAQQVFLKELEEPKPNLYVILCTTDPQYLLPALKSRLTTFIIQKPNANDIAKRLAYVCKEEGVDYSMAGLTLLANKKDRIPREVFMTAEFIATSEPINVETVQENLLIVTEDIYMDYLNTVKNGKLYEVLDLSNKLTSENDGTMDLNINSFAQGLGNFIVTLINLNANIRLEEYDKKTAQKLKKFVKEFTNEQLVDMLKVIKNYSHIDNTGEYLLYTFTVELFDIFELERREDINISDSLAKKRYAKMTSDIRNTVSVVKDTELEIENIGKIFRESTSVDVTGAKINQETGKINKENKELDIDEAQQIFGGE